MLTQEIRRKFLQYFKDHQHSIISSSPVVPHDDPTLLFINAGMNQFKDVFLGKSVRDYKRAATSQKCIRVGGKHNDLENVGHTRRHLTLFEMLGNFSFGDYFKEEAIKFAWEVATQVFGFEPDRIWPTVFREDDEAFEIWKKYVPAERITRFDEKDNFWAMGDTGPCGPCSELLYDRGPAFGKATKPSEDPSGERFLEFWNLVFMQFNRQADGKMDKLPKPSIDTGAGLERIIMLKMGVDSVYETDVLGGIIKKTEEVSGVKYDLKNDQAAAFRVIADHLRCLAFAISDGVQPSNVDRGYVLRKVLRRAVRYGRMLGMNEPFLAKILPELVRSMGPDYPELVKGQNRIAEILTTEEEAFIRTLNRGGNILNQIVEKAKQTQSKSISGDDAFKLKDTYGLPIDEILLLAKDAGLTVDTERYLALELEAKERSRGVAKSTKQIASENLFEPFVAKEGVTAFKGFTDKEASATVKAIVINNAFVDSMMEGQEGMIVLSETPFYAEMGGQVGDKGTITSNLADFVVEDTVAPFKGVNAHVGKISKGKISVGDKVKASIDFTRREKIQNNHTATHLLHWALHEVLGQHIKQAGSVVDADRLRFDFSHHKALSQEEVRAIEDLVNAKIRENLPVKVYELDYETARKREDIKQFFGEKYGSVVRVIDIDYSKELCGGTHTNTVGNIGYFRIAKEGSISAGVRRIEAVTGAEAEAFARESDDVIEKLAALLKIPAGKVSERIEKLQEENKVLAQSMKELKQGQMNGVVESLLTKVEQVKGIPVLFAEVAMAAEELKMLADGLTEKMKSGVLVLGGVAADKCQVIVRVTPEWTAKGISAGNIVKSIAPVIEGSGGGKPDSAQAGGKAPNKMGEALAKARELL